MENYKELLEKAKKDLEVTREQKIKVQAKIDQLVTDLDLDPNVPLEDQLKTLKENLEKQQKEYTDKLNDLVNKLKEVEHES